MATSHAAGGSAATSTSRPSVIQLAIKEKPALYAAYIPYFPDGGIFIPTPREHKLGDDVYLLLTVMDNPQRFPIAGKVAWITPANAAGNRTQGIGVQFPADEKAKQLRRLIEEILGPAAEANNRPTHTL
ncbi:MAG: PilZ domain-containing protein [Betaproteobacteria bacterium]|jgi:type IV pilus assembly protein PilZ|uniref:PilZ domain-containing protein n=1 Tax=Thiomonas sp. FB-6 TaxID=1158291 RepID=UPI00036BD1F6|nr:PilZ domain-containing protein [Thiomonas sp. FB-6]MBU6438655.1 PilZ domain-containing protein [Betaproteobacteria bacterium]MBU6512093.1 PilZ domain-containing protein [Betaproteobacteria bacterium]MDE1955446.1 PilZ domain-containing protein [Betaproteobacteria bacterium]MDE2153443.1 PilZ domain-containing protein [Betaproteobacteria bacterium]MDE2478100.1 PilZ domain-containing protein [Betaproteobacteria bacterium]